MVEALIQLLIVCLVVAIVASVLMYCVNLIPIEPKFHQIIRVLIMLIAALVIIMKALPLLTASM